MSAGSRRAVENSEAGFDIRKTFLATNLVIAANLLMFFILLLYHVCITPWDVLKSTHIIADFPADELILFGANYGPDTLAGGYWRAITFSFLHASLIHLAWNMLFLWRLGRLLDVLVQPTKTTAIFILCGIAGGFSTILWHPTRISVGSSAATAGFAGVLIALLAGGFLNVDRRSQRSIWIWAVLLTPISIVSGMRSAAVDTPGHLGGFVAGIVIGVVLTRADKQAVKRPRDARRVLFCIAAFLVIYASLVAWYRRDVIELHLGESALRNGKPNAIPHLERFLKSFPDDAIGHEDLATAYEQLSRDQEAAAEYRRVLEIDPDNSTAQYALASIYMLSEPQQAVALFRKSIPHLPESGDKYFNFASALRLAGNLVEARDAAEKSVLLDPKSARNHGLLSAIFFQLGDVSRGLEESRLAQRLAKP